MKQISKQEHNRMVANILAVYKGATKQEIKQGLTWYNDARQFCNDIANAYSIPMDRVAHVLAALSPNVGWERNKTDTFRLVAAYYQGGEKACNQVSVNTYGPNKAKAIAILATGDLSILSGQKVTAFADNIANQYSNLVTVDVHAYSVAKGFRYTANDMPLVTPFRHRTTVAAYNQVANELGLQGYQLQAIVWLTWKRLHGIAIGKNAHSNRRIHKHANLVTPHLTVQ